MSEETSTLRVSADDLKAFCQAILEHVGLPANDAELVADTLVAADLGGVHSHGVMRLSHYVPGLIAGAINLHPRLSRVRESRCTGLLDGDNGMGQIVAVRAMEWAVEMTLAAGIGVVGVRNSNHFGTCGYYARMAIQHDYIGIVLTNGFPTMAPWGGKKLMLGNHPLAIAIPTDEEPPVVLDISTSVVSQGKVILAAKKGETIPDGWAMDREGRPTQDPQEALDGLLMPLGEHKGYGLSLVIAVLSAALTGAAMSWEMVDTPERYMYMGVNIGHFLMAIDVQNFVPLPEFKHRMDEVVRALRESPKAAGVDRIFVPGEMYSARQQTYLTEGIPMDPNVMRELRNLANQLDLNFHWPAE